MCIRDRPSALLAVALVFVGVLCFASGLILDTVVKGTRKEYELCLLYTSRCV